MKRTAYLGQDGDGKTLHMVIDFLFAYLAGKPIYTNMKGLKIPHTYIDADDIGDAVLHDNSILDSYDGPKVLGIDEIQTVLDGRNAMSRDNRKMTLFVSQIRKRKLDLIYTSQYVSGADPRVRQLIRKVVNLKAVRSDNDIGLGTPDEPEPIKFIRWESEVDKVLMGFARPKKKITPRWVARALGYRWYDSWTKVKPAEGYVS